MNSKEYEESLDIRGHLDIYIAKSEVEKKGRPRL